MKTHRVVLLSTRRHEFFSQRYILFSTKSKILYATTERMTKRVSSKDPSPPPLLVIFGRKVVVTAGGWWLSRPRALQRFTRSAVLRWFFLQNLPSVRRVLHSAHPVNPHVLLSGIYTLKYTSLSRNSYLYSDKIRINI
jgi:hypothetical protein